MVGFDSKHHSSFVRSSVSESVFRENELREKIHPECGQHHPMGWGPALTEEEEAA